MLDNEHEGLEPDGIVQEYLTWACGGAMMKVKLCYCKVEDICPAVHDSRR